MYKRLSVFIHCCPLPIYPAYTSHSTTAADDMIHVVPYLTGLTKKQINTLGKLLGLSVETVNNCPDPTPAESLTYILDQWAQKPDKVKEVGKFISPTKAIPFMTIQSCRYP